MRSFSTAYFFSVIKEHLFLCNMELDYQTDVREKLKNRKIEESALKRLDTYFHLYAQEIDG